MAKVVFGAFLAAFLSCMMMNAGIVKKTHLRDTAKLDTPGCPY